MACLMLTSFWLGGLLLEAAVRGFLPCNLAVSCWHNGLTACLPSLQSHSDSEGRDLDWLVDGWTVSRCPGGWPAVHRMWWCSHTGE